MLLASIKSLLLTSQLLLGGASINQLSVTELPLLPPKGTPRVGDFTTLDGVASQGGASVKITHVMKNIQFNPNKTLMLVRSTTNVEGQDPEVQEDWQKVEEMFTKEMAPQIAKFFCNDPTLGGKLETVETPAGNFKTCKIPADDENQKGFVWVGGVPFGVVQMDITNTQQGVRFKGKVKKYAWK